MNDHLNGHDAEPEATGNAAAFFLDRHIRQGRGSRTAFIDDAGSITYLSLCHATSLFARGLAAADIRREARIALILLDSIAFPVAFWGALRAGIVPVPINTLLPPAQILHILQDCRAQAAIISAALHPSLAGILAKIPALRLIVVDTGAAEEMPISAAGAVQTRGFAEFIAGDGNFVPPVEAKPDELAFLLYTSGSTGAPKGVRHVHASLRATADTYGAQVLGITPDDVVFSAAKLFFAYGLGNSMTFPLSAGATAVLSSCRPTVDHVLAVMARERPSIFMAVPTLFARLLQHHGLGAGAGSDRLRSCISAGEALPAPIGTDWHAITGVDILEGVGTTEMLHIFVSNRPGDICYGTAGRAVPGYNLRLVDENGDDVEDEGAGEMLVRGESMADGYWSQRAKTQSTFRGDWVATGDRYMRDTDGRYRFCGRVDDMIKVNGIWVSPVEVEASLRSHDAVLAAAVVGYLDADDLVKPRAVIVLRPPRAASPMLIAALQEHVKKQIGAWKYPRRIDFVPSLPESATGKIQRFALRAGPRAALSANSSERISGPPPPQIAAAACGDS
jgi:4-hydroxybenzoate-CoA ligase